MMRIHVNNCEFTQACSPLLIDDVEYRALLVSFLCKIIWFIKISWHAIIIMK